MAVLSILLAVVVIAVLAAALLEVRRSLHASATGLATLADALETVESEHLRTPESLMRLTPGRPSVCWRTTSTPPTAVRA